MTRNRHTQSNYDLLGQKAVSVIDETSLLRVSVSSSATLQGTVLDSFQDGDEPENSLKTQKKQTAKSATILPHSFAQKLMLVFVLTMSFAFNMDVSMTRNRHTQSNYDLLGQKAVSVIDETSLLRVSFSGTVQTM